MVPESAAAAASKPSRSSGTWSSERPDLRQNAEQVCQDQPVAAIAAHGGNGPRDEVLDATGRGRTALFEGRLDGTRRAVAAGPRKLMVGGVDEVNLVQALDRKVEPAIGVQDLGLDPDGQGDARASAQRANRGRILGNIGRVDAHVINASQLRQPQLLCLREVLLEGVPAVGKGRVHMMVCQQQPRSQHHGSTTARPPAARMRKRDRLRSKVSVACRTASTSAAAAALPSRRPPSLTNGNP